MAKKRFTDIEIWDKEWYMELTPKHKCLMKYIFDKCDASGCWKPNWKLASLHINDTVDINDLSALPNDQYEMLTSGKIFIPDFINFQYGTLSEKSPAHNPVFLAIEKNNLSDRVFNRVQSTPKEKDKEKEIDKEEEKDKEKDKENEIFEKNLLVPEMLTAYVKTNPNHPKSMDRDFKPLHSISTFLHKQLNLNGNHVENKGLIIKKWEQLCNVISEDKFYKQKSLSVISNNIQEILQIQTNGIPQTNQRSAKTGTGKYQPKGTGGY